MSTMLLKLLKRKPWPLCFSPLSCVPSVPFSIFFYYCCVCDVCVRLCVHYRARGRSEDNPQESVLAFDCGIFGVQFGELNSGPLDCTVRAFTH